MNAQISKTDATIAQYVVNFMNNDKNFTNGKAKTVGACRISKDEDVISLTVGNKTVVRLTLNEDGQYKREFRFFNGVAVKRIHAVLNALGLDMLGIHTPRTGTVYMTKANGTDMRLNTGMHFTYQQLVGYYNSGDEDAAQD